MAFLPFTYAGSTLTWQIFERDFTDLVLLRFTVWYVGQQHNVLRYIWTVLWWPFEQKYDKKGEHYSLTTMQVLLEDNVWWHDNHPYSGGETYSSSQRADHAPCTWRSSLVFWLKIFETSRWKNLFTLWILKGPQGTAGPTLSVFLSFRETS